MANASRLTRQQMGTVQPFQMTFHFYTSGRFSRAEACVAIVLKPLQQALLDEDPIYATVVPSLCRRAVL